jgi:uncharacterized protein (TIGR02466 family)
VPADPFAPIALFSYPLFATMVGGHEQHRQGLIDEIQALKRKHPGVRRSNRDAWHSGDEFVASRNEHVGWMLKQVMTYSRHALAPLYDGWAKSELKLGHYWANVLGEGGWNAPHHHHPQHWSAVYYVSVGETGTTAEDPHGMIEFLNPSVVQSAWGGGSYAHAPKDGNLLLWPSSLVHLVHPHRGEGDRISIALNMNVVPKP